MLVDRASGSSRLALLNRSPVVVQPYVVGARNGLLLRHSSRSTSQRPNLRGALDSAPALLGKVDRVQTDRGIDRQVQLPVAPTEEQRGDPRPSGQRQQHAKSLAMQLLAGSHRPGARGRARRSALSGPPRAAWSRRWSRDPCHSHLAVLLPGPPRLLVVRRDHLHAAPEVLGGSKRGLSGSPLNRRQKDDRPCHHEDGQEDKGQRALPQALGRIT
jgi:hypothetical protein